MTLERCTCGSYASHFKYEWANFYGCVSCGNACGSADKWNDLAHRQTFENYCNQKGFLLHKHIMSDNYKDPTIQCMWEAWRDKPNTGIKTHDGQKLLVQHILDTDEGLSENSRKILEELIK